MNDNMQVVVKFLRGNGVIGANERTICHSKKPKRNRCYAISHTPAKDDWVYVINPDGYSDRDGWWCPDCIKRLEEVMKEHGYILLHHSDTIIPRGGNA